MKPIEEWNQVDRQQFTYAWKKYLTEVMKNTKCVITTDSNSASEQIKGNFGGDLPQGIVLMQDKGGMEIEARTWVSVVKLNHSASMVDLVMVGDMKHLSPFQVNKQAEVNEFASQGALSFYARLLQYGVEPRKL